MTGKHQLIYIDAVSMIEKDQRAWFGRAPHQDADILPCAIACVTFTPETGDIHRASGAMIGIPQPKVGSGVGNNRKLIACGLAPLMNRDTWSFMTAKTALHEWLSEYDDITQTWVVVNAFDSVLLNTPTLHKPNKAMLEKIQAHLEVDLSHAKVIAGLAPTTKDGLGVSRRALIQARYITAHFDMAAALS